MKQKSCYQKDDSKSTTTDNLEATSPPAEQNTKQNYRSWNKCGSWKIEKNYHIFRRQRGLTPAKFYSNPLPNISTISRFILDKDNIQEKDDTKKLPSGKILANPLTSFPSQWLLNSCHSPLSSLRPWVTQGKLQQCWRQTPLPCKHPPSGSVTKEGVLLRSVEKDSHQCVPRSGSCSRLDKMLRRLVDDPPEQPKLLPQQQAIIMRPTLANLLLLKDRRSKRFPQLLPAGLDHTKAAISRGTSPVADFGFSKNILGLNAMGGEQALERSPGILQRFH